MLVPCPGRRSKGTNISTRVYRAFYQCCSQHLAIRCGGLDDINKHIATAKHKLCEKDISSMRPLQFSIVKDKDDLSVIRAETVFTRWLVNHNIQLAAADGFGDVLRSMVPDSKIAHKYKCARTKSTHIALTLASDTAETLARAMREFPFSLATDGSNDNEKLFPMVITYFDDCAEEVRTSILSVPELTEASNGSNIAGLILEQLKKYNIQVGNMLSFVSDNTASMVGCHNGVTSKLREAHPHLLTVGCACHLINLAAKKSFQQLPVRIDELLLDIYYYLEPSDKRMRDFKNYQLLHNDEVRKILKYCQLDGFLLESALIVFSSCGCHLVSLLRKCI